MIRKWDGRWDWGIARRRRQKIILPFCFYEIGRNLYKGLFKRRFMYVQYMFYISKSIHSSTLAVTRTGTWRLQGPKMASGILERKTRRSMRLPCSQGHWHTSCPHTGDQDTHAHSDTHTHTCRGTDSLLHTLMQTKSPFNWKNRWYSWQSS